MGLSAVEGVAGRLGAVHRVVGRIAGVVFVLAGVVFVLAGLHDTLVYWWL